MQPIPFNFIPHQHKPLQQSTFVSGPASKEISLLPEEILLRIFSFLSLKELAKCNLVCRTWKRLASDETLWYAFDPKNLSPLIKFFDESDWSKYVDMSTYGLTTGDIPSLDKSKELIRLLKRVLSSPLMTEIERDAGVTVLTIPNGLTFNKFVKLAGSPKAGHITKFGHIWDRISSEIGDIPVNKTYRIVITNNVFKKSRNLSISEQKALVNSLECEMPRVLEAIVLLGVTFMSSEKRLLYIDPWTRCLDQVAAGYYSGVVAFTLNGIQIMHSTPSTSSPNHGVGGVFQF